MRHLRMPKGLPVGKGLSTSLRPSTLRPLYRALSMLGCVLNWYPSLLPCSTATRMQAWSSDSTCKHPLFQGLRCRVLAIWGQQEQHSTLRNRDSATLLDLDLDLDKGLHGHSDAGVVLQQHLHAHALLHSAESWLSEAVLGCKSS